MIQAFPNLSPEHRDEAIRLLIQAEPGINDDDDRAAISGSLRDLLNHHRTIPDADWALPAEVLDAVESVYRTLEPRDPIKKFSWLFSPAVRLPRPINELRAEDHSTAAWRANEAEAANQRRATVEELLTVDGSDAVFRMAAAAEAPGLVGTAVADLQQHSAEQDPILIRALTAPDKHAANVAYGLIAVSFQSGGESWASALLARAAAEKWGDEAVYRILSSLPQSMCI